jgi:hypothetical protein
MLVLFALVLGSFSLQLAASPEPSLPACALARARAAWTGSCPAIGGENLRITLVPAPAITSGVWREGPPPAAVWAGTSQDGRGRAFPIELETYADRSGVLRTEYGWFPVSDYDANATALRFQVDTAHEVAPNALDRRIIDRADALLSSNAVWNRSDNRRCRTGATAWSIYCAMERAETEVTGGFHHRRPAIELVREIVDERTAARGYHHRLMEYNNDPSTTLADVRSLFAEARGRIKG